MNREENLILTHSIMLKGFSEDGAWASKQESKMRLTDLEKAKCLDEDERSRYLPNVCTVPIKIGVETTDPLTTDALTERRLLAREKWTSPSIYGTPNATLVKKLKMN